MQWTSRELSFPIRSFQGGRSVGGYNSLVPALIRASSEGLACSERPGGFVSVALALGADRDIRTYLGHGISVTRTPPGV